MLLPDHDKAFRRHHNSRPTAATCGKQVPQVESIPVVSRGGGWGNLDKLEEVMKSAAQEVKASVEWERGGAI